MADLIDSYSETNQDSVVSISSGGIDYMNGQSFMVGSSPMNLTSCKFMIRKNNLYSGTAYAKLFAHTGTYGAGGTGTGDAGGDSLAVSTGIAYTSLPTSLTLTEFSFPTPYTLSANTPYVILLFLNGGDDNGHDLQIGYDASSPSHAGNRVRVDRNISWTSETGNDTIFYVYGEPAVTANTTNFFQLF